QYAVAHRLQPAVLCEPVTHQVLPVGGQDPERVGFGQAQVGGHLGQRVAQPPRLAVLFAAVAATAARHPPSSIRPSRTRSRRSGWTASGTLDAVVINACPAGSWATSASPRSGASSLNTSSSSSTGS